MPELKVCGVTSAAFAQEAARLGVDYLGLIFADGSPRRVDAEAARAIASAARGARLVGVFTSAGVAEIAATAAFVPLDVVQLHGRYDAAAVKALKDNGLEVWRLYDGSFAGEDATLLDGRSGSKSGGTGRLADWSLVARLKRLGRRVVLAGGISAGNVLAAAETGADILDANSSLETTPGVKSVERLRALLAQLGKGLPDFLVPGHGGNR